MHMISNNPKMLKTHAYSIKNEKQQPTPGVGGGGGNLAVLDPSVEEHLDHTPTQLRTHARTTRTRNETETDFPIGFS